MKILRYMLCFFFYASFIYCNHFDIGISSNKTFSFPVNIDYSINSDMSIHHINRFYNINYPHYRYLHSSNIRDNITMISEVSYIQYNKDNYFIKFGRDYIDSDISSISGLFFSSYSPSINHGLLSFVNNRISARMIVSSLSKDNIVCGNELNDSICDDLSAGNHYINRWFYYRHLSYEISDKLQIGVGDAIISSGENRGVEFYYLLPLASFQAEQLHNMSRQDFVETNENYGVDNDNGFMFFDIKYLMNKDKTIYASLLIDDFQIDKEDREHMQDVFGLLFGFSNKSENTNLRLEYSYASPWLYINSGLFTNYINYSYPIGLRSPHSQSIDLSLDYKFSFGSLSLLTHLEQRGIQTFSTIWDAWDNKIDYFNFNKTLKPELLIRLDFEKQKIPSIIFFNNWKQKSNIDLVLNWEYNF